ncbi:Putative ribonuclease H protein At1g65750 [Linum perenne]
MAYRDDDNFEVETPIHSGLEDVVVQDLMMRGVPEWDEEHILQLFGSRDAMQILSIPLGSYNLNDKLIWHFNKDGRYTVRSAYRVYMERVLNMSHLHVGGDWTSLWAFRAQPKIKHFAWRLSRGELPTRTTLCERRIGVPVACGLCEGPPETLWHLFFECDTCNTRPESTRVYSWSNQFECYSKIQLLNKRIKCSGTRNNA